MDDGEADPIRPELAAIMIAVIDHIDPETAVTPEGLYQRLVAEMASAPSLHEVRTALDILSAPHLAYTHGEPSGPVLDRIRLMLTDSEQQIPRV
ncbi:hypothetical protein [Nocardia sp. AG03]|uniref:hypothetical protein n=1 Tax=Nocardia sp. AG03 TaxID=3025312 RepID=UPI002418493E|nr:hypothetical protein [Nocardia sp. AG03]